MADLKPSPRIRSFIQNFEQCRLKAYLPTPNDRWTCGWGTTGPDVGPRTIWTQVQADSRFASDLANFAGGVTTLLAGMPTSQAQYDAMVSLAYNIGLNAFGTSTLLRKHKGQDFAGAADEFARWNKQKGAVLKGLTRRRAAEAAIYRGEG